jgi:hypothetical protein
MREFERAVGETALVVRCDSGLATQAEWLLRTVGKVLEATPFKEGMTIQVGWTRFSLRTQAGRVLVCEPSFHGNPFVASSTDVTVSLAVLSAHDEMIQLLGVEPEPVSFHHSVLIHRGCLSERRIFMERKSAAEGDASGWVVGVVGQEPSFQEAPDPEKVEWIRSTELLRVRRPLIVPLFLPPGYVVTWDADAITSLESPAHEQRWSAKAAEVLRGVEDKLEAAWQRAASSARPS